jgi:hypothetical protein
MVYFFCNTVNYFFRKHLFNSCAKCSNAVPAGILVILWQTECPKPDTVCTQANSRFLYLEKALPLK